MIGVYLNIQPDFKGSWNRIDKEQNQENIL